MSSDNAQTVLVIDNDEDLTRALAIRLSSSGFRCLTAASGTEGVARFHGDTVDLIVSDLNMQDGDGVELAETIRRTSEVPIIFVTGFRDDFKRRLRCIQNVTTLRTPFKSQELINLIAAALGEHAAPPPPLDTDLEIP